MYLMLSLHVCTICGLWSFFFFLFLYFYHLNSNLLSVDLRMWVQYFNCWVVYKFDLAVIVDEFYVIPCFPDDT